VTQPRLLPAAEEELRHAVRWYEDQRAGLGAEFLGAVDAALAQIAEAPARYPVWMVNRRFRRMVVRRFFYMHDLLPPER